MMAQVEQLTISDAQPVCRLLHARPELLPALHSVTIDMASNLAEAGYFWRDGVRPVARMRILYDLVLHRQVLPITALTTMALPGVHHVELAARPSRVWGDGSEDASAPQARAALQREFARELPGSALARSVKQLKLGWLWSAPLAEAMAREGVEARP